MKNKIIFIIAVTAAFCGGYMTKTFSPNVAMAKTPKQTIDSIVKSMERSTKKVTGIGGIFFKCKDPKKLKEWYKTNLGLQTGPYGAVFQWYQGADSTKKGFTQWSTFKETTTYFEPSKSSFMINYRIGNIDLLVDQLKKAGVTICDTIQRVNYGNFVHIMDPEGNKIELWEPIDSEYGKMGGELTK